MPDSLQGRIALITGGGSGIGLATAQLLAQHGATVIVAGRRPAPLDDAVTAINAISTAPNTPAAFAVTADLADPDSAAQLAAHVLAAHGRCDILVNNAGFSSKVRNPRYISAQEWRDVMDVNTTGPLVLTRELLPGMIERGHGDVVLVSSLAAIRPGIMAGVAYSAAKIAGKYYMDVLRDEVRGFGVRCTTVYPGEVDTPILANRPLPPGPAERATMMHSEDIAQAILLAVTLPQRTTLMDISLGATQPRDFTADVQAARDKQTP